MICTGRKIKINITKGIYIMKSLAELTAIRDKMQDSVVLRRGVADVRVVVAMGTCGIAAGEEFPRTGLL